MDDHRASLKPLLVAAPASGSGKTTVTLGILAALRRRGVAVAPFKVGPDFIDPGHHAAACGRVSRNLDGWMCGEDPLRRIFARGCRGAEVAVIEGVMGLFDGASGEDDRGSSAEIARRLGTQVLLVVDARSQARSAAALVQGFVRFDPALEFAGVILNRVGSPRHAHLLRGALASVPGLPPVLGCLPREEELTLPSRHLGLVTAADLGGREAWFGRLAQWVERHLDLDRLLAGARGYAAPPPPAEKTPGRPGRRVRLAVARDAAFCFCYPENLEALEAAGAELVFFSPLDGDLPEGIGGLYLPGGYPELHAERLAANGELRRQVRQAAEGGLPIYAECGGFMFLARELDGRPMCGVFPARARMLPRRRALGYRDVAFAADTVLGPRGTRGRGHEFHYSDMEWEQEPERVYRLRRPQGETLDSEGFRRGNVLGSYVHLHFGSNPELARHFVKNCLNFLEKGRIL